MFRRFMIVCWVLFGLSMLFAGIGFSASAYYSFQLDKVESLIEKRELANPEKAAEIRREENRVRAILMRKELLGELAEQRHDLADKKDSFGWLGAELSLIAGLPIS